MICSKQQQLRFEANQQTMRLEVHSVSVDVTHKLFLKSSLFVMNLRVRIVQLFSDILANVTRLLGYSDL